MYNIYDQYCRVNVQHNFYIIHLPLFCSESCVYLFTVFWLTLLPFVYWSFRFSSFQFHNESICLPNSFFNWPCLNIVLLLYSVNRHQRTLDWSEQLPLYDITIIFIHNNFETNPKYFPPFCLHNNCKPRFLWYYLYCQTF